jgi:hypothetical protein
VARIPSDGRIEVGVVVGVDVAGGVDGGGDTGGPVGTDPVGLGELLVADAEGDVLVDGADFVGDGDCRPLDDGPAEWVALGVFDAVSRLVPGSPPPAGVAGTEAVVGVPDTLAGWPVDVDFPDFPVVVAVGVRLLVSRIAMIAMIPQAARPTPASSRARRLGREPPERSGSSL